MKKGVRGSGKASGDDSGVEFLARVERGASSAGAKKGTEVVGE